MSVAAICSAEGIRRKRAAPLPAGERRLTILDAAVPLIIARGEAVTTLEIAQAAGIAEGTIFRVFESKDALIGAAVERAVEPASLESAIAAVDRSSSRELALVVADVVRVLQRRSLDAWQLISSLGPRFNHIGGRPNLDSVALAALFEGRRGEVRLEPPEAARYLRAVTFAMTHPMMADRPAAPAEVARRFLCGVGQSGFAGPRHDGGPTRSPVGGARC
jgi:AcrR family transcriptional regulator